MRAVIVEDDAEQRDLLALLCARRGIEVIHADSVATAQRVVPEARADVVLTDYDLGDGYSSQLFRDGTLDPARTIVITGHRPRDLPPNVRILGKPLVLDTLFEVLREVAGGGDLHDEPRTPLERNVVVRGAPSRIGRETTEPAFVLYVADAAIDSVGARKRVEQALAAKCHSARLEVVNLTDEPARADEDRVVFTPCLIRVSPAPRMIAVGDMRDAEALEKVIGGE